jgi:hypothetical protein
MVNFVLCAATFGAAWLLAEIDLARAPLYYFWAGMAYMKLLYVPVQSRPEGRSY